MRRTRWAAGLVTGLVAALAGPAAALADSTTLQNAVDGGRRTCVSVNAPEPVRPGSNADLAGYRLVSDVTRVRLRAVADALGGGFTEFTLDS